MMGRKLMTAAFLSAALAGCQTPDDDSIGVFSCTDGERGASVTLREKTAELTLTAPQLVTLRPYIRSSKTVYRDVGDHSAVDDMKKNARAYCSTGIKPQ